MDFDHPPKFYLKNVQAKAKYVPPHLLNQVDPPPHSPEKCPNASRKVPQKFWNQVIACTER